MRMGAHACVTQGGGEGECELREVRMCATQVAGGKSIPGHEKSKFKGLAAGKYQLCSGNGEGASPVGRESRIRDRVLPNMTGHDEEFVLSSA